MRFYPLARPLAAALLLALCPALAAAQSASYDFTQTDGGFKSVVYPAGGAADGVWSHGTLPFQSASSWSIQNQGQGAGSAYGLQSPTVALEVMTAGPVTGSFTHLFSFGVNPEGEGGDPINHDGGVIQYRRNGTGDWLTLGANLVGTGGTLGYATTNLVTGTQNPLAGFDAFSGVSPNYGDVTYDTTNFTLGETVAFEFVVGDTVEVRFVAGFAGNEFTSNGEPNWQIGSVSLFDASPVPEPGGVLGAAALAVVGFRLRRRVTSASRRTPAS